jgi:glycosyltransferase involved in cell wall biosynthesis
MSRVVFVNRFFFPDESATSQLLHDLTVDLAAHGFQVSVITSRLGYGGSRYGAATSEIVDGVHVRRIWTTRFGRRSLGRVFDYVTFYVSAFWVALHTVNPGDILVAKTDPPVLSVVMMVAARLRHAKLINWLQDLFPEIVEALWPSRWLRVLLSPIRMLRNVSLRSAETNVVIGGQMKGVLLEQGVPSSKLTVIHNWADRDALEVAAGTAALRAEWDVTGKYVVGYSGNLGRAHDLMTVVQAAAQLAPHSNLTFVFVGEGQQKEALQAFCQQNRLSNVMFRGYVARAYLGQSLRVPDVHVVSLNPRLEGLVLPSKIYGVMAVGAPVIFVGDRAGEVASMVQRIGCGIAVAAGDAEGFAAAVDEMSSNPARARAMGQAGRSAFLAQYDRAHATRRWADTLASAGLNPTIQGLKN